MHPNEEHREGEEMMEKACPYVMIANAIMMASGGGGRVLPDGMVEKEVPKGKMRLKGVASWCLGEKCQMWTGADCGLKNDRGSF